jgi:hypothetical protein
MAAHLLGAEPEIVCLTTGVREEPPADFSADLHQAYPDLKHVSITYQSLSDQITEKTPLWSHKPVSMKLQGDFDELFVVPTRGTGHDRITIFGSQPEIFVHNLTLPNILFWPEEHVDEWTEDVIAKGLSDRLGLSYTLTSKPS